VKRPRPLQHWAILNRQGSQLGPKCQHDTARLPSDQWTLRDDTFRYAVLTLGVPSLEEIEDACIHRSMLAEAHVVTGPWHQIRFEIGNKPPTSPSIGDNYGRLICSRAADIPAFVACRFGIRRAPRQADCCRQSASERSSEILAVRCRRLFALVGLSVVAMARVWRSLRVIAGFTVCFGYYMVLWKARTVGMSGALSPFIAAWLPNVVFVLITAALMAVASRRTIRPLRTSHGRTI
jgi:hypothetical protein